MLMGVVEVVRVSQKAIDCNRLDYPTGALLSYAALAALALLRFAISWPLSVL